jgi:ABC-type ATPase involved in cell division
VIVATHDRGLIAREQRRVLALDHGRVVGEPSPEGRVALP